MTPKQNEKGRSRAPAEAAHCLAIRQAPRGIPKPQPTAGQALGCMLVAGGTAGGSLAAQPRAPHRTTPWPHTRSILGALSTPACSVAKSERRERPTLGEAPRPTGCSSGV